VRLILPQKGLTQSQQRDLFDLSNGLSFRDRRESYDMILSGMPPNLLEMYSNVLNPPYKSDGSIPGEEVYRKNGKTISGWLSPYGLRAAVLI